jgi:hypothetical protein
MNTGIVSETIYNDILKRRGFDLYGHIRTSEILKAQEAQREEIMDLAGVAYEKEPEVIEEAVEIIDVPDVFQRLPEKPKALPLVTAKWKIGHPEIYNAPVGFSKNPANPMKSLGHEVYYSYDGDWENGKMHGFGMYFP